MEEGRPSSYLCGWSVDVKEFGVIKIDMATGGTGLGFIDKERTASSCRRADHTTSAARTAGVGMGPEAYVAFITASSSTPGHFMRVDDLIPKWSLHWEFPRDNNRLSR